LPIPVVDLVDVSDAMVYLCGPSGRFLTGVTLPIDGGLQLR
jgi:NAD(P)-dependent dehydrogenase (short-subunit alcohol dehydrogenase family)